MIVCNYSIKNIIPVRLRTYRDYKDICILLSMIKKIDLQISLIHVNSETTEKAY